MRSDVDGRRVNNLDQSILDEWMRSPISTQQTREQDPVRLLEALANNNKDDILYVVNITKGLFIWHVALLLRVNGAWYSFGRWPQEDLGIFGTKKLRSLMAAIVPSMHTAFTVCFPDPLLGINHYASQKSPHLNPIFSMEILAELPLDTSKSVFEPG